MQMQMQINVGVEGETQTQIAMLEGLHEGVLSDPERFLPSINISLKTQILRLSGHAVISAFSKSESPSEICMTRKIILGR